MGAGLVEAFGAEGDQAGDLLPPGSGKNLQLLLQLVNLHQLPSVLNSCSGQRTSTIFK